MTLTMAELYKSREELKRAVHNVHDFIRNKGAGYGTDALKIFNFFYALMRISSNKKIFEKLGLTDEFLFENLLEIKDEDKLNEKINNLLDTMLEHRNDKFKKVRKLIWSDLPIASVDKNFYYQLIRKIKKISEIEGDLSSQCRLNGKVYEYFIGRDKSAISNLGAYFTDRFIIDYIYNRFNFELENEFIPTFVDPFGGSGGFTIAYIQKMNELYPEINWEKNIERVSHFDMADTVVKNCAVEVMTITGEVPEYRKNFNVQNSFSTLYHGKKFKLVFTNFPYGGDKSKATQESEDRKGILIELKKLLKETQDETLKQRIKEQMKQIDKENKLEEKEQKDQQVNFETVSSEIRDYVRNYNSKFEKLPKKQREKEEMYPNDKEECGMILMNMLLAENGTACGVIKQGCFFDKKYRAIRKDLIENYNVEAVIRIPADAFENTTTATSILIYHNTPEKTSQVKFYDMIVEKIKENKYKFNLDEGKNVVELVQRKGDLLPITDKCVAVASVEQIRENDYTFDAKKYNPIRIIPNDGWEMKKLGDFYEFQSGYAFKKTEFEEKGIPLISIKNIVNNSVNQEEKVFIKENSKYNKFIVKKNDLLVALSGNTAGKIGYANYDIIGYLNQRVGRVLSENFSKKYLLFIYKSLKLDNFLYVFSNGSVQKNFSTTDLSQLEVPFPTNPSKIQEWTDKISKPFDEMNSKREEILKLEKQVQKEIKRIIEEEDCEEKELGEICEFIKSGKDLEPIDYSIKKTLETPFPYIASGSIKGYTKNPNIKNKCLLMGRVGAIGNIRIFNYFSASSNVLIISLKDINIIDYLYWYLSDFNYNEIEHGSVQKLVNKTQISKIKIPIPTNPQVLSSLNPIFNQIEHLNEEVDNAEKLYQQYLQELHDDAIKEIIMPEVKDEETQSVQEEETEEQIQEEEPKEETLSEESSSEEEEEPQPKKKVVIKKKLVKKTVPKKKISKK